MRRHLKAKCNFEICKKYGTICAPHPRWMTHLGEVEGTYRFMRRRESPQQKIVIIHSVHRSMLHEDSGVGAISVQYRTYSRSGFLLHERRMDPALLQIGIFPMTAQGRCRVLKSSTHGIRHAGMVLRWHSLISGESQDFFRDSRRLVFITNPPECLRLVCVSGQYTVIIDYGSPGNAFSEGAV